jgi:hypothetical protein
MCGFKCYLTEDFHFTVSELFKQNKVDFLGQLGRRKSANDEI